MKLKEAIEIGEECGLYTLEECVRNIELHSTQFFAYTKVIQELNKLHAEYRENLSKQNLK